MTDSSSSLHDQEEKKTRPINKLLHDEFHQVGSILKRTGHGLVTSLEALDGHLTAYVCCPETPTTREFMAKIMTGRHGGEDMVFDTANEAQEFFDMLERYSASIANCLESKGNLYAPHIPLGKFPGTAWAWGFILYANHNREFWTKANRIEDCRRLWFKLVALASSANEDPKDRMYPELLDNRFKLICSLSNDIIVLYEHFAEDRRKKKNLFDDTEFDFKRLPGRNDQCPCGSGKKYKRCCGAHMDPYRRREI